MTAPLMACQSARNTGGVAALLLPTGRGTPMADAETPDANKEARDDAAGKTPGQQAKEGEKFLEDERKRELPKDSWPGKGEP